MTMTRYPYSVKNVKTLATHDGQALTAVLYHGSKKVGSVEDGGTGGGAWPRFVTRAENDAFTVWVTSLGDAHYPASKGVDEITFPHSSESALELLLSEHDRVKSDAKLDRVAKGKLVYREASDGEDGYREAKLPESVKDLPLPSIVAMYQQKGSWFAKASDVWVIGVGWTPISAIKGGPRMSDEQPKEWGAQVVREKKPYTGPTYMGEREIAIRDRLEALDHGLPAGHDQGGEPLSFARPDWTAEELAERQALHDELKAIQETE